MSEILLVSASSKHAAAIQSLTREAYAKWVPVIGREPLPMAANYEEALINHPIELLYADGKLAALIELIPADDHLLIENIAVAPLFQGRGFGRKLMAHAEQIAKAQGQSEIRLYTNKLFVENILFYEKLGYKTDREEPFRGGTAVHMSKLAEA